MPQKLLFAQASVFHKTYLLTTKTKDSSILKSDGSTDLLFVNLHRYNLFERYTWPLHLFFKPSLRSKLGRQHPKMRLNLIDGWIESPSVQSFNLCLLSCGCGNPEIRSFRLVSKIKRIWDILSFDDFFATFCRKIDRN